MNPALLLLAMASMNDAEARTYYRDDNWAVMESGPTCTLVGFFKSKSILWIRYDFNRNKALLTLTSPSFKSADSGKKYLAKVDFVLGDSFSKRYEVAVFEGTTRGADGGIQREYPGIELLDHVSSSDAIALTLSEGTILAALDLERSAKAVGSLKVCAKATGLANPIDLLDGAEIRSPFGKQ